MACPRCDKLVTCPGCILFSHLIAAGLGSFHKSYIFSNTWISDCLQDVSILFRFVFCLCFQIVPHADDVWRFENDLNAHEAAETHRNAVVYMPGQ